jgi:Domain of unknown function (DUF4184)
MPWTFAHPAAVLPLRPLCPHRLSFGALVVGSVSPDIGYYVSCFDLARAAHTLLGLVAICLPTGLALTALARALHRPVAALLPNPHRQAVLSLPQMPKLLYPTMLWKVSISILIGAMTHVTWDSFTHATGYLVTKLPILRGPAFVVGTRTVPVFELLQHASTALGVAVVLLVYVRWLRSVERETVAASHPGNRWRYCVLGVLAATSMAAAVPVAYFASSSTAGITNIALFVVRYVMALTTVFAVMLSAASLLLARRTCDA